MLTERRFRRLDRARLARPVLRRATPELRACLDGLAVAHARYAAGGSPAELRQGCQGLVQVLNGAFDLPAKRVLLRDRPRPHRRRGGRIVYEVHGQCDPEGLLEVYTRTAAKARPVALRTLLNTLLHEWVHHYDFALLGESVHCSGFYERLGQVYKPARDWLDRPPAGRGTV